MLNDSSETGTSTLQPAGQIQLCVDGCELKLVSRFLNEWEKLKNNHL